MGVAGLIAEWLRPGSSGADGPELWRSGRVALTVVVIATNLIGVAALLATVYLVVPLPPVPHAGHDKVVNGIAAAVFVALAVPVGAWLGSHWLSPLQRWLIEDRPAGPEEQRGVLLAPLRLCAVQMGLWLVAAAGFGVLDAGYSGQLAGAVVASVVIAGLITATCAYLLIERILRSITVRALSSGLPERIAVPGVATRAVLAWALGSGLPVLAIILVGGLYLGGSPAQPKQLAVAMVALSGLALAVGILSVTLAARATAAPLDAVRRALESVEGGDFDTQVGIWDGTQIGQLQIGFNQMARGLAERERLRATFGTYVDPAVAERILGGEIDAAGELVEVSVMFVDVRDFTSFAESRPAEQVVAALNQLFEAIVPVIHRHGGRVDKYMGDGLLAVFGAPRHLPDHAERAVRAALEMAEIGTSSGLRFGIGINTGPVVAGNVGGAGRLEFSVIGDVVNVAARVEEATRQTGDTVLVAERTRDRASGTGCVMAERPGVVLKGKAAPVRVYAASAPPAPSTTSP